MAGRGKGWEATFEGWLADLAVLTGGKAHGHRHEPKMNANKYKVPTGLPDWEIVLEGRAVLVEIKEAHDRAPLGWIFEKKDKLSPAGVTPIQAKQMDAHLKAGALCFVAVRLVLSDKDAEKARQTGIFGRGELALAVQRLVPWSQWRALMQAAEDARRVKGTPKASLTPGELDRLGFPLRNAPELLKALRGAS